MNAAERIASIIILSLTIVAAGGDLPRGSRGLWNVQALDAAPRTFAVEMPCSNEYGRVAGVAPIWIEGEPYRGRPTRVFAWWGLPEGASARNPAPAMVLVHGGGGTAFAKWVKLWNARGYAAIAMDTCGKIPQGERDGRPHGAHPWSGPSGWGSSVAQVNEPITDQWTYHAVAAVMRCHSFLRARPEVDAARTGLTGISWGGYLTSIVMDVDARFRFAAPVYGCGWYDLNPQWDHMGTPGDYRRWLALWDPRNYLREMGADGGGTRRVLWCCGTNDRWYPLNAVRRSYSALGSAVPVALSLKLRMPHGHPPAGDPREITALADSLLRGGAPLVEITEARLGADGLFVAFDAHGRRVARAELLATCDANPVLEHRPWTATPVAGLREEGTSFITPVPADAVMFFANVVTDDGLVTSTRIFERVMGRAAPSGD
ncbi:MAG: alpha/beta hydrolase family protein [Kiritimatiellia bacterium]